MDRRTMLGFAAALVGGRALLGPEAVSAVVRQALALHADIADDWEGVVADLDAQISGLAPSMGVTLEAHLAILTTRLRNEGAKTPLLRAAAGISQLYGLWLNNAGRTGDARDHFRQARLLADQSGDALLRAAVRARTADRGPYAGYTIRQTLDGADEALAIHSGPGPAAINAHAAKIHIHALTGNLGAGRECVTAMQAVADKLSGDVGDLAQRRTALFRTFFECRVGDWAQAERTFQVDRPKLAPIGPWLTEMEVYYGRSKVTTGDTAGGISYALDAVREFGRSSEIRVVGFAVRDLVQAVPAGHRSDDFAELRSYASREPGPWETLV